jgi:hypothetical protein
LFFVVGGRKGHAKKRKKKKRESDEAKARAHTPAMDQPPDLDAIIQQLLEIKGAKPGKQANLSENDIR